MKNDKPPPLPPSLAKLPRYAITSLPGSTRDDNDRSDIAFGVTSIDVFEEKLRHGFANPRAVRPVRKKLTK